ncbi:MAG: metallophosphoesterase [Acidobacteriota bacterium]
MRRPEKMRRVAVASLLVAVAFLPAPPALAHDLFTRPYLVMTDNPSCMRIHVQTDTHLHGGWIRWGYTCGSELYLADMSEDHQNIKNEEDSGTQSEDFIRWSGTICAQPGQSIRYKVYLSEELDHDDDKAVYAIENTFVMPLIPAAKHLTFFGYGDTRDCGSDFENVTKALLSDLEDDSSATQTLVLHSGDVVYNGGQTHYWYSDNAWMDYFKQYSNAEDLLGKVPVAVAMGNHDFSWEDHGDYPKYYYTDFPYPEYDDSIGQVPYIDDDGDFQAPWDDAMSDAYHSFDYGPIHVSVLNAYHSSELDDLGGCHMGSGLSPGHKQYDWLERDLAGTNKPWKLVLIHVAPLSCDCQIDDRRRPLEALAKEYGVDLIIAGHDHYYKQITNVENGIVHLVLGGGGAKLDPACTTDTTCRGCFFHFAKFQVRDDARFSGEPRPTMPASATQERGPLTTSSITAETRSDAPEIYLRIVVPPSS